jgi:nitroimidazol reductase NimA-like FMN-containing flavoprotein (pyridoxamine 5'-phosphate oxidase superfamily)
MRRKDRELHNTDNFNDIINRADVCRIAFAVNNIPYIVTMNFGYKWGDSLVLYFHCAKEGKKLDFMKQNNSVCFEMDIDHEIIKGNAACEWSMKYKSIIGYGLLEVVEDVHEKKEGFGFIMDKYGYPGNKEYNEKLFNFTEILKLNVIELSGKERA